MNTVQFDVCVSGAGPVARALALALSGQGWKVALACDSTALQSPRKDIRTYALNARAVALLDRLKVWVPLQAASAAVHEMRIRGDDGGQLSFSAWQQCVGELTWIVDAGALDRLLGEALRFSPNVTVVPPVEPDQVGSLAPLLAVCEGKWSATRASLGASFTRHEYGHWAVGARLVASRPHLGVARQWFRSPDILALLPFNAPVPGASYGLVWSVPVERAQALQAMSREAFEAELRQALLESDPDSLREIGQVTLSDDVQCWPLAIGQADPWCGPGWVLLGDAAHQVHPMSGHGLNLGLADVDKLVEVLGQSRDREPWRSVGDERVLRRYARERWLDTRAMAGLTDTLLHLFSSRLGVARELRNRGMGLIDRVAPIKRWLVGQALDA
jgi:2-polyprenyl-6-methoxyphenol hydroxylase-like FAD-dependent oxidoreductase